MRRREMRAALLHIGGFGCENYTRGHCEKAGRVKGAEYTADAWCDACVANAALRRPRGRESYYTGTPSVSGSAPVQGPGAEPVRDETQR